MHDSQIISNEEFEVCFQASCYFNGEESVQYYIQYYYIVLLFGIIGYLFTQPTMIFLCPQQLKFQVLDCFLSLCDLEWRFETWIY